MLGKSNFEFIRSTDPNKDEHGNTISTKIKKKVVSYYLDENTIKNVKRAAVQNNTSCSGLVGDILKIAFRDNGSSEQ